MVRGSLRTSVPKPGIRTNTTLWSTTAKTRRSAAGDTFTMRGPPFSRRMSVSFRLRPEARSALERLCHALGLTKTRAIEMLLLQEIGPRRLSAADLGRRRPDSRIEEIRHLIQLARGIGDASSGASAQATLTAPVLAEIHRLLRTLGQSLKHRGHRESTRPRRTEPPERAPTSEDLP